MKECVCPCSFSPLLVARFRSRRGPLEAWRYEMSMRCYAQNLNVAHAGAQPQQRPAAINRPGGALLARTILFVARRRGDFDFRKVRSNAVAGSHLNRGAHAACQV